MPPAPGRGKMILGMGRGGGLHCGSSVAPDPPNRKRYRTPYGVPRFPAMHVEDANMRIKEREDELFDRWAKRRPGFVRDGVVDEPSYLKSGIKLLLVLKEVNSPNEGGWDLRQHLREGQPGKTWTAVAQWVHGVRHLERDISWDELGEIGLPRKELQRRELLRSVCVMNLKKSPGGSVSDPERLEKIAQEDRAFLNEQFRLYSPDLVICGGTSHIFQREIDLGQPLKWRATRRGIRFHEFLPHRYVIAFWHPHARVGPPLLYYGLIDAIKEIRKEP